MKALIDYLGYQLHKFFGIFLGSLLRLIPSFLFKKIFKGSPALMRGICAPNGDGDGDNILAFKANFVRAVYDAEDTNSIGRMEDFSRFASSNKLEYFVLCGQSRYTDEQNAQCIVDVESLLRGKRLKLPAFYALVNEDNGYSYERVNKTITLIKSMIPYPPPITKGATTSIVESGGIKTYFNYFKNETFDPQSMHLIHFYLKYADGSIGSKITNFLRKSLFTYMVFRLKLKGVSAHNIIIDEANDGTALSEDSDGDALFAKASGKGWIELESMAAKMGLFAIGYYQAPFLSMEGNTVLEDLRKMDGSS